MCSSTVILMRLSTKKGVIIPPRCYLLKISAIVSVRPSWFISSIVTAPNAVNLICCRHLAMSDKALVRSSAVCLTSRISSACSCVRHSSFVSLVSMSCIPSYPHKYMQATCLTSVEEENVTFSRTFATVVERIMSSACFLPLPEMLEVTMRSPISKLPLSPHTFT